MTWLENHNMQLTHGNKILYVNSVERSPISWCVAMMHISVLPGKVSTCTWVVMLESSVSVGIYKIVILVILILKVLKS